jgi:N-methylhydantoinase B
VLGDRADHAPFGVRGGGSGQPNKVEFVTEGKTWTPAMRSKEDKRALKTGDTLRANSPGGGGYGNPLERDLDAVERDLNGAYISRATAEQVYGVVIASQSTPAAGTPVYALDRAASEQRRQQLASQKQAA